jgi:GrpB-like predicted nucleotidyltransferase (UPF0157 family)
MRQLRNIVVVPYIPLWPELFRREADALCAIFGSELVAIHHIGSTSIPGMSAKPIVDIMPLVRDIRRVDRFDPVMIQRGYEPRGENGIDGRRYFVKGGDASRTHHVHTYEPGNPEVARHLNFRDYLIAHPEEASQYAKLKQELARRFPHDIESYIAGKDAFIKGILQKAAEWRA